MRCENCADNPLQIVTALQYRLRSPRTGTAVVSNFGLAAADGATRQDTRAAAGTSAAALYSNRRSPEMGLALAITGTKDL